MVSAGLIAFDRPASPIARGGWLDALRFIVAFLMILHHFHQASPVNLTVFHPVFDHGYLLTNFFLMDSGYVLARIYGEAQREGRLGFREFMWKRVSRVAPAHLILLGLLVIMTISATAMGAPPSNPKWFDWNELPAQVFLVQAFGVPGGVGWNAPTWSLSALLGCYLVFPLMVRFVSARRALTALAIALGVFLAANLVTWQSLGYPVYQMPLGYGIWRALPLFFIGVAMAGVSERVWINPKLAGWVMLAAFVGLCVAQFFGRYSLISLGLIATIILMAGAIPVTRRSPIVEQAALISFSIFLSNEIVRIGWFGVAGILESKFGWSEGVQWFVWAASIPSAVIFAAAFHYAVDAPIQRAVKRWKPARKVRSEAATEAA